MKCPLNALIDCDQEDIYGACFFCQEVAEGFAVSKIPILETESLSCEDEDI